MDYLSSSLPLFSEWRVTSDELVSGEAPETAREGACAPLFPKAWVIKKKFSPNRLDLAGLEMGQESRILEPEEKSERADARCYGIARPHPCPLPPERGNSRADGLSPRRWPVIENQSCGEFYHPHTKILSSSLPQNAEPRSQKRGNLRFAIYDLRGIGRKTQTDMAGELKPYKCPLI